MAHLFFSFSALNNPIEDFDQGKKENYRHTNDIISRDKVFVTVDLMQMGVGGDNSWGGDAPSSVFVTGR